MSWVTHPVQVGSNLTATLELIDQALYRAKHAGKNCAVFHAELNA